MSHKKTQKTYRPTPTLLRLAISACVAFGPYAALQARADAISVQAVPLGEALLSVARQSGVRVSFDPSLVEQRVAQPVTNAESTEKALEAILSNSGLDYVRTENGTFTIVKKPNDASTPAPQDVELSALTIWAKRQELGYAADSASAATRTDTSLLELPRSVSIVTKELVADQQITSVTDALRNVSGVSASKGSNGGMSPSTIVIRGFEVENAMTDGMISSSSYGFNTPLFALEKIEVVKGPEGITGGTAAKFGGVVNMVTKKPLEYTERQIQATVDSNGTRQVGLDITGPLTENKNLRGRLIALGENGADTDLGWDGGKNRYWSPQIAWDDGTNNILIGAEFKKESQPAGNSVYSVTDHLSEDSQTVPHAKDDRYEYDTHRYYFDYARYLGNDWEFKLKGQHADQKGKAQLWLPYVFHDFPGLPAGIPGYPANGVPAGDILISQAYAQNIDHKSTTIQTSISKNFLVADTTHDVLIGYDYLEGEYNHNVYSGSGIEAFLGGETATLPSIDSMQLTPLLLDNFYKTTEKGYFFQDQASLTDNLDALISARRVSFKNQSDTNIEPVDKWLYGLGLTYKFTEDLAVYGSYSEGVKNSYSYLTRDGSTLPPTEAKQYEIGAKFSFYDQRLVLTTALFKIQEQNVPEADPVDIPYYRLIDGLETTGIEVELRGKITSDLNVSLAYTGMRVENLDTGSTANGNPWRTLNIWTTYEFAQGWSIGGGIDARSSIKQHLTGSDDFSAPGQARIDAMLKYEEKSWNTIFGVRNIADRRLYSNDISPYFTYVEPERTFTLSTTVKF